MRNYILSLKNGLWKSCWKIAGSSLHMQALLSYVEGLLHLDYRFTSLLNIYNFSAASWLMIILNLAFTFFIVHQCHLCWYALESVSSWKLEIILTWCDKMTICSYSCLLDLHSFSFMWPYQCFLAWHDRCSHESSSFGATVDFGFALHVRRWSSSWSSSFLSMC